MGGTDRRAGLGGGILGAGLRGVGEEDGGGSADTGKRGSLDELAAVNLTRLEGLEESTDRTGE